MNRNLYILIQYIFPPHTKPPCNPIRGEEHRPKHPRRPPLRQRNRRRLHAIDPPNVQQIPLQGLPREQRRGQVAPRRRDRVHIQFDGYAYKNGNNTNVSASVLDKFYFPREKSKWYTGTSPPYSTTK